MSSDKIKAKGIFTKSKNIFIFIFSIFLFFKYKLANNNSHGTKSMKFNNFSINIILNLIIIKNL